MADELILIVEDNEKNLKLTRDVLQFNGFRTLEARTAEDGLALAQDRRPDLILMDIQLPGIDGVTALEPLAIRSPHGADSSGGADGVRDEGRSSAIPSGRLRRLRAEADQRERAADAGTSVSRDGTCGQRQRVI